MAWTSAWRPEVDPPSGRFVLPEVETTACTIGEWATTQAAVSESRYDHTAVWTGTEMMGRVLLRRNRASLVERCDEFLETVQTGDPIVVREDGTVEVG